jgi:hypothetical protein
VSACREPDDRAHREQQEQGGHPVRLPLLRGLSQRCSASG